MSSEYKDITQHEIEALKFKYNLADAHTHQSQSSSQQKIVESLPELWRESENTKQHEIEQRFTETFFRSQRQLHALKTPTMLVYAASVAMIMAANYLMKKKMRVSLLEPCFDNIHDILKHMNVPLEPLQEAWFYDPSKVYSNLEEYVKTDAIFLIDPNNPTGFTLSKKSFLELFRYAKDYNKLLIFDFCFASFLLPGTENAIFEIYEELDKSGASYITIEDTGKIWPLQDTKVAMLKTSKDIYEEMFSIYTSYLLNVSPFILNIVTKYVQDSVKDNFESVNSLLSRNREIVKKSLEGSLLEFQEPKAKVSVAWFKIKNPKVNAKDLQKVILAEGVYVLPGTYFFWSDHEKGDHYVRIALARNTDMFEAAVKLIRQALDKYEDNLTN